MLLESVDNNGREGLPQGCTPKCSGVLNHGGGYYIYYIYGGARTNVPPHATAPTLVFDPMGVRLGVNASFGQQKRAGKSYSLSYESDMVPKIGVEPTLRLRKRILSPPRLPFRHFGIKGTTHSIVRELQLSLKL